MQAKLQDDCKVHMVWPRSQAVSHSVFLTAYMTFEPLGEAAEGPAWYIFYVIKPQGTGIYHAGSGLDHDVCGLGFSNHGNVPTHVLASTTENM